MYVKNRIALKKMLFTRAYLRLLAFKSALLFSDVENFGGLKIVRTVNKTFRDSVKIVPTYLFQLSRNALMLLARFHGNFNVGK